MEVFE